MKASGIQQDGFDDLPAAQNQATGRSCTTQGLNTDDGYKPNDPFHNNAALWLDRLPPDCTVRQLIRAIISVGPTGRILFCSIVRPCRPRHRWEAKVVFATRSEARRLRAMARAGLFFVQRHRIYVDWHQFPSSSFHAIGPITRVVMIEGPSHIVNRPALQAYFKKKLTWLETEEVIEVEKPEYDRQRARIIWRFGSWFNQAQDAVAALQEDYAQLVDVRYGLDPCAYFPPADFQP